MYLKVKLEMELVAEPEQTKAATESEHEYGYSQKDLDVFVAESLSVCEAACEHDSVIVLEYVYAFEVVSGYEFGCVFVAASVFVTELVAVMCPAV